MSQTPSVGVTDDFGEFDAEFDKDIDPATGSSFPKMDDLIGCLLLLRPYREGTRPSKNAGQKDYVWVECDVHVLKPPRDEQGNPQPFPPRRDKDGNVIPHVPPFFAEEKTPFETDQSIQFSGDLVTPYLQQKMAKGKLGLGILDKGKQSARNRSAPWVLNAPSEDDLKYASQYWGRHKLAEQQRREARAISSAGADWS